jgi:hypothetical protein
LAASHQPSNYEVATDIAAGMTAYYICEFMHSHQSANISAHTSDIAVRMTVYHIPTISTAQSTNKTFISINRTGCVAVVKTVAKFEVFTANTPDNVVSTDSTNYIRVRNTAVIISAQTPNNTPSAD